jgi:hypothetical protein
MHVVGDPEHGAWPTIGPLTTTIASLTGPAAVALVTEIVTAIGNAHGGVTQFT